MADSDRIFCRMLAQRLSWRMCDMCRERVLHLLPAPLRGLLHIALRGSTAGYARLWAGSRACRTAQGPAPKVRSPAA